MKVNCKVCKADKTRIWSGKRGNQPIFRDDKNKRWNGLTCPECNCEAMRLHRKDKTEVKRELLGPNKPLYKEVRKNCVRCGDLTTNYYRCSTCLTNMRNAGHNGILQAEVLYG